MESAGTTPRVAVDAPELSSLFEGPGPFATVYLTTEAEIDNAAQRSELRWRALRDQLATAGTPEAVLEAIDLIVPDAHLFGRCLAVVADAEGVLHIEHHDQVPHQDVARWAPLPSVVPLLEWRQSSLPHVVVTADRQGADIVGFRREAPDIRREAGGGYDPLRKSAPGGWSQKRYQQRAENVWERNAQDVAAEVAKVVGRIGARVVTVAGDVRAVALLREALPAEVGELIVPVEGDISDATVRAVADAVARDTVAILGKFREELGQADRAVDGPGRTVEALRQAQVDVLLVHDDVTDDAATAWFGEEPTQVGNAPEEVRALGADSVAEGRLADIVVRAAFGTGAGVRVVPRGGGPTGGVGAILRWS